MLGGRWSSGLAVALFQVIQDSADQAGLSCEGDYPHPSPAAGAHQRVDLLDPSDEIRPYEMSHEPRGGLPFSLRELRVDHR